jgi:hypothetical protein
MVFQKVTQAGSPAGDSNLTGIGGWAQQNFASSLWNAPSILAQDPDDATLNLYICRRDDDGSHFRIRRLQANFPS